MGAHAGGRAAGGGRKQASVRAGPNYGRVSRAALLAGASAFALAGLGASGVARATCLRSPQIISTPISGPIFSNGGAITITGSGDISGDPDGVDALTCPITTLTNQSGGKISGGNGAAGLSGGTGGAGVSNASKIATLTNSGTIHGGNGGSGTSRGGAGGAGVSNIGTIATLTNSGQIAGRVGGSGLFGGTGGAGVSNAGTIMSLTNSGAIGGGNGGFPSIGDLGGAGVSNAAGATIESLINTKGGTISGGNGADRGNGGDGVSNAGTIRSLTNGGTILGGVAGNGVLNGYGVLNLAGGTITKLTNSGSISGGYGVANDQRGAIIATLTNRGTISTRATGVANVFGMITTLTNSGTIRGAEGVNKFEGTITTLTNSGKIGGAFAVVNDAGTITTLTNRGAIIGFFFAGGLGVYNGGGTIKALTNSGVISGGARRSDNRGGAGVSNLARGTITTLTNSGTISGGNGVSRGVGGTGVSNAGTITTLSNSGAISDGNGGSGGDAIFSAGANASIGPITNSGRVIGNVEIDNQASVTVTGGRGRTFGQWTGGAITIGNGNLTFAGGNTVLGNNISTSGGLGMVTNEGVLQLTGPQSITGSFVQTGAGVLDLGIAGKAFGQYGALQISAAASLDGGLGLDLLSGFSLALGDKFDVLSFSSYSGGFDALSLDGGACSAQTADVWRCYTKDESWYLTETIGGSSLYQQYVSVTAETPVPEPSTLAL